MNLDNLALEIIVGLCALFVGLYVISIVSGVMPVSDKLDYAYTTGTNTTSLTMNSTANATQSIDVSTIGSITGETPNSYISGTITSTDTTNRTATILFNGVIVDTLTAANSSASTFSFDVSPSSVIVGINNITASTGVATTNKINLTTSSLYYPSGTKNTEFGTDFANLVTSTGTVFDVMILVIIITALGVGLYVLRGFTGSPNEQV
jgi:hypothetical protein